MRCFTAIVLFLLILSVMAVGQESPRRDLDAFTVTITSELFLENPEAAELFVQANDTRAQERFEEAAILYARVLELEPEFYHATRRLAGVMLSLGRREEALQLSRKALEQAETTHNLHMLLSALVGSETETEPTAAELNEARELARKIVSQPNVEGDLLPLVCQTAAMADDLELLRDCSLLAEQKAPDQLSTHYFTWLVAVSEDRYEEALRALERAREAGLPDAEYERLMEATEETRPVLPQYLALATKVFPAWLAGLAILLVAGLILSHFVMRSAEKLSSVQTGGSVGSDALLRGVYRVVLWLSCAYYFLSIPLVVLGVLIIGGGILYGFMELGRIPVKLVLIVALVILATVWSGLKGLLSIVRQPEEEDPGERLEVSDCKDLRKVLAEVASVIGTRPADSVYMTPGTEIAVMERGGLWRQLSGSTERCLILGTAVLEGFRIGPFKAVLAHEYGHFCNKDTAGGGFVIGIRRSLDTMARSLAESGAATWYSPAWIFLHGFSRVFLVLSQGASRLQEVMADRWAAFAYGPENFEEGLRHVIRATVRFNMHSQNTLKEVVEGQKPLSNFYRYQPEVQPDEDQIQEGFEGALHAQPSIYDSHPSPIDRITWVRRLSSKAGVSKQNGDAWDLFTDRQSIEKLMTAKVRGFIARHYGVILVGDDSESTDLLPAKMVSEEEKRELRDTYAHMSPERLSELRQEPGLKPEAKALLAEELSKRSAAKA